jgi:hypothetical protein
MSINYSVLIRPYAEKHFIKKFKKKYKGSWEITWRAISQELQRFDSLLKTSIAEVITECDDVRIAKTEFRVHRTNESKKSSGNRCIVAVHKDTYLINVLLVYNKPDLEGGNETAKWKKIVKNNYPEYSGLL